MSILLGASAWGQTPELKPYERTGTWAGFIGMYMPKRVAAVSFEDSPRMETLMRAGQIYLSLRDAIALALENNLDIEYARFGPRAADANQMRASAGQLLRNISSSISSGPSSASLGVLSGASALGSGGGSSGGSSQSGVLSGVSVQLAGSGIPNLDPVGYVTGSLNHITSPQSSNFVTGTSALVSAYKGLTWGVQKGFLTGTTATLSMSNTIGLNQNSPTNNFNPTTNGNMTLSLTQHLLQGFGLAVNNRAIRVAKNQRVQSDLQFKAQVIATVSSVASLYWDLVSFNDNLRVKREALKLNEKLYSDNKRRAELGAIAPIDIVQAEAEVAASQQDVTVAELQVLQQEMILKSAAGRPARSSPGRAWCPPRSPIFLAPSPCGRCRI
jgi:outer membrane protein TolC